MYIKSSKTLTHQANHYRKGVRPLVNTTLLKEKVKESGYRNTWIAEQLGISAAAWNYKLNGHRGLKVEEVNTLCKLLKIKSLKEKVAIFYPEC